MPEMKPVWDDGLYIGTAYSNSAWTYSLLCEGIQGMPWAKNEQIQQYFFMCGKGGASNEVTGMAPEIQVTGKRIVGDTAQDYIVSKMFATGEDRKSSVKLITGGKQYVCDCTLCDIVGNGGQTLDNNTFAVNIRLNGLPTESDAPTSGTT